MYNKEIADLHLNILEILCPQMTLHGIVSLEDNSSYNLSGTGRIHQDVTGNLVFTIMVGGNSHLQGGKFYRDLFARSGPLILVAVDTNGYEWQGECIHTTFSGTSERTVIKGILGSISTPKLAGNLLSLWITTYEHLNLPTAALFNIEKKLDDIVLRSSSSREAFNLEFNGIKIIAFQEDNIQRIWIQFQKQPVSEEAGKNVINLLSFMTGCIIRIASIKYIHEDCNWYGFYSRPPQRVGNWLKPPLPSGRCQMPVGYQEVAKMFYEALSNTSTESIIWPRVNNVIHASDTQSLRSFLLTLVTAIEGIVVDLFKNQCVDDKKGSDIPPDLLTCIQSLDVSQEIKGRLKGAVCNVYQESIPEILSRLADDGKVSRILIPVWRNSRNHLSHGSKKASKETDNTRELPNKLLTLYYMVVFAAIDYKGVYWDYSENKSITYPLGTPLEILDSLEETKGKEQKKRDDESSQLK